MDGFIRKNWWKLLGVGLILYSIIAGFLIEVPDLPIIRQSIRNLFFHVVMWFTMMVMFGTSLVRSLRYLSTFDIKHDVYAIQSVNVGLFFGMMGIVTGMEWANFTWGTPWTNDPQLNGAAITILAYFAYLVLRRSIDEENKRARIAAVYNVFAFVMLIVFIGILPKLSDGSLHPGKGGSPMTVTNLDVTMRLVFYPAIAGWIIVGYWLTGIRVKMDTIRQHLDNPE
ncbi:MAG: cytochrome c biogenesis protein CcsA [Bacteroidales bacterium]